MFWIQAQQRRIAAGSDVVIVMVAIANTKIVFFLLTKNAVLWNMGKIRGAGVRMRMRIFFLTLVFSLSFSAAISAKTVAFTDFSIDIPEGWNYSEDGDMLTVTAKDNSSILVLSPDTLPDGQTLAKFAADFAKNSGGGKPAPDGSRSFQFDYTNDVGARAHVILSQADEKLPSIFLIVIVGENHPELPGILQSVRFKK